MLRYVLLLLLLLGTVMGGCSKTEQPAPEGIPPIPPGRSKAAPAQDDPTDPHASGPMPAHPRQGRSPR